MHKREVRIAASTGRSRGARNGIAGRAGAFALVLVSMFLLLLTLPALAFDFTYTATVRASASSGGAQGDNDSYSSAISADGRYLFFQSWATNLVPGDTNGASDIFVRDLASGETTRVSVSSGGAQGDNNSYQPALSGDGRYLAFYSYVTNLVPGDTNADEDVFRRDLASGETTLVSASSGGVQGNSESEDPVLSEDGRYVAFKSWATNLVPGDTNGTWDIFRRDIASGDTTLVTVSSGGAQANATSQENAISADGRYITFESYATNLVPGDSNGTYDVFRRDLASGETTRVSVSSGGVQGNNDSYSPAISADGRDVFFQSSATNLVPGDTNVASDIFMRDLASGETTRVSVSSGGVQGDGGSAAPALSADGRFVTFTSSATNLVPGDTNGVADVFVRDLVSGETLRATVPSTGGQANGDSYRPVLSEDGRYAAFDSVATNLVPGDTSGVSDVFVRAVTPVTSLTVLPSTPEGSNGWYLAAPQLALSADSATATTHYRWDSGSWQTYTTTLTAPEGGHTLEYYSAWTNHLAEPVKTASWRVDSLGGPSGTMALAHGAALTTARTVSVDCNVTDASSGVDKMRVGFADGPNYGSGWIAYTSSAVATLTSGDGTKTVYVQVRDGAGNVLELADTIKYTKPKAALSRPVVSPSVPRRPGFATVYGYITPRVAGKTRLYLFRKMGRRYVRWKGPIYVSNRYVAGANRSKWTYRFRPPYPGSWYAYAYWPGDVNTKANTSAKRYFSVR